MSNTFICVRSVLLFASLLFLCHSTPIAEEVSTSNSYDEKEGIETSNTESDVIGRSSQFYINATEGNRFDAIPSSDGENTTESKQDITGSTATVPQITNGESETDASKKRSSKRNACRDNDRHRDRDHDDGDDDDDDEREERGEALLRSFAVMYERAKRAFTGSESEGESATQADNDFIYHVLDYNLERKKREQVAETNTRTVKLVENNEKAPDRKKRQSGETVPYIIPNRSRREESSSADEEEEEGEQYGRRIKDEEEAEEEEEEEKKEEFDEKLAMDS